MPRPLTRFVWLLPLVALTLSGCAVPRLRSVYTEHLGQLTGTVLNPSRQVGITGTDLGVSFVETAPSRRLIVDPVVHHSKQEPDSEADLVRRRRVH